MIGRDDRVQMERAHVFAWPALRTAVIDGWLWRPPAADRSAPIPFRPSISTAATLKSAIAEVESRYRALGAPARFQVFDETSPAGLAALLQARGYRPGEPTTTMFKRSGAARTVPDVEIH